MSEREVTTTQRADSRCSAVIADITMQDIRLVCGEGKLENRHVLNAVNIIIKRRAEMAALTSTEPQEVCKCSSYAEGHEISCPMSRRAKGGEA